MSESNVAQDQIKAYVDRILRMKEEAKAINADIREIYAEAKGNGFDKTVLGQLVSYVEKRQTDAATLAERSALFDLYLEAFDGAVGRPSHAHTRERASGLTYGDHLDEATKAKVDPAASLRADPSLHIVSASEIKPKSEPQPSQPAGSDLASPSPQGQVAPHPVANVEEDANGAEAVASVDPASREVDDPDRQQVAASGFSGEGGVGNPGPTTKYAAPGVVTWETYPPEGVTRSAVSIAFANIGQDAALIRGDLEKGRAEPIVKIGREILDGWARFMTVRDMTEMDGKPMAYAVVQYAGTDPLIDAIKWNVGGRVLDEGQKRKIAATLVRQNSKRKDDIYRAFELWMEPV